MPEQLWIAVLLISEPTAAKIREVHGVDVNELRDQLVAQVGLPYKWDDDPERGRRALVETSVGRKSVLAVLYPVGDDVYRLGSAYPRTPRRA